jgi:hypothetical protein
LANVHVRRQFAVAETYLKRTDERKAKRWPGSYRFSRDALTAGFANAKFCSIRCARSFSFSPPAGFSRYFVRLKMNGAVAETAERCGNGRRSLLQAVPFRSVKNFIVREVSIRFTKTSTQRIFK